MAHKKHIKKSLQKIQKIYWQVLKVNIRYRKLELNSRKKRGVNIGIWLWQGKRKNKRKVRKWG